MSEQTPEEEASVDQRGTSYIGDELRAARIARSMDISEVARRLNLEEHVVEGLEQGNYENLPELAYIRGYLLAYIRLLDLPVSLLKRFDEEHPLQVALVSPSAKTRSACSRDGWVKCISWGLVILLLIVVGIWVAEQYFNYSESGKSGQTTEDVQQTAVSAPQQPVDVQTVTDDVQQADNEIQQDEGGIEPDLVAEADVIGETTEEVTEAPPAEESVGNPVDAATMVSEEGAGPDTSSPIDAGQQAEAPPEAEPKLPVLSITFLDTSWVSISNSAGKQLRGGTFNKGYSIELEHEGELRVIIGRAKNVELTYAGEAVDLSGYASVARLNLGKPAE